MSQDTPYAKAVCSSKLCHTQYHVIGKGYEMLPDIMAGMSIDT